ncbi:MAG: two-component system NtrC family sensor kinase, partial [Planctomycetota bacterium]
MERPQSQYLRFLLEASVHLEEVRDADKALKNAVRLARDAFEADEASLSVVPPGQSKATVRVSLPGGALWESEPLVGFLNGKRPRLTPRLLLASIERRGRPWGVLALRNRSKDFTKGSLREVTRLAGYLSRFIQRIDRMRLAEVREKLDRKMMEQLRPRDLFYQILHGLRSLTRYDHSASILTYDDATNSLKVAAAQVTWRKGASRLIGSKVTLHGDTRALLLAGGVHAFDRKSGRWWALDGKKEALPLADLLATDHEREQGERQAKSRLVAPLVANDGLLGVLEIASCHPGCMGIFEAELVKRFRPVAAVAMSNMGRTTSLETGILEAERKNALATLARGVSHDVNNAFGSVLPIVQQLIVEAKEGRIRQDEVVDDLAQIEASLQVCRRIFGGMLSLAQGIARSVGEGDLARAIEGTTAVLEESMRRQGIDLEVNVQSGLPLLRGPQSDLEQLLLNLASNACDAMSRGGRLGINATLRNDHLIVSIEDTGVGISESDLGRVKEPFYSTKKNGTGLGLSICRSVVWKMRGKMKIDSEVGSGTTITL